MTFTVMSRKMGQEIEQKPLGSIALARSLCYQINGAADDSDDIYGGGYGSVDIAEILSAKVVRLREALAQPEQEPSQWRDMIVATLVREAINKHKARELADHFAAQRPWIGLEPKDILDLFDVNNVYGSKWIEFARTVEVKLKERNK
jgi:hypothetical protein